MRSADKVEISDIELPWDSVAGFADVAGIGGVRDLVHLTSLPDLRSASGEWRRPDADRRGSASLLGGARGRRRTAW